MWTQSSEGGQKGRAHLVDILELLFLLHAELVGSLQEVLGPFLGLLFQVIELLVDLPCHFLLFHYLLACGHCILREGRLGLVLGISLAAQVTHNDLT